MKRFVLMLSLLMLVASVGFAGEWTGFISDAKCKHATADKAGCMKSCIEGGQPAVLVEADGTVHEIADQDKVKEHAGHKVTIKGSEADGKIKVESVAMAD